MGDYCANHQFAPSKQYINTLTVASSTTIQINTLMKNKQLIVAYEYLVLPCLRLRSIASILIESVGPVDLQRGQQGDIISLSVCCERHSRRRTTEHQR
jgi:hypothetical protein